MRNMLGLVAILMLAACDDSRGLGAAGATGQRQGLELVDDNGTASEPGDDNGTASEPGDDNGTASEPGDDNGAGADDTGADDGGGHGGDDTGFDG